MVLLGFALLPCGVDAQDAHGARSSERTSYVRRVIDSDQGLPETQVNALAQTPDGYLWLGTRRGVVRYDGLAFRLFAPEQTPALPTGQINGLSADRRGRLWIATARGLAVRVDGAFRRIATSQVPDEMTWDVLTDRQGRVWVAGASGVRVGDGERFALVRGATGYTYALHEDARGRIWMAGREFLASIAPGEPSVTALRHAEGERFFDLTGDSAGTLWVGTRRGVVEFATDGPNDVRMVRRIAPGDSARGNEAWALTRAPDGSLWIGTEQQGVLRWDGRDLTSYDADGSFSDPVWTVLTDARGRVWAGTSAGMLRFQRSAFATFDEGLRPRSTWSVRGDPGGMIVAATSDGATYRLDGTRWRLATPRVGRNFASGITARARGGVLVARDARELLLVGSEGVRDVTQALGLRGLEPSTVVEDRDGTYWVTTNRGLRHVVKGEAREGWREVGLDSQAAPTAIVRDAQGRLLIGETSLTIVDRGRVQRVDSAQGLRTAEVRALLPEAEGVWIGTGDAGLFLLRDGRVTGFGRHDARLGREILGIVKDDLGFLWLTSSFGLYRVEARALLRAADGATDAVVVRGFDRGDGLPTTEFNGDTPSQIYKDADGHLWLPSYAGVVRVDPWAVSADARPPQVHLERLVVDGVEQPLREAVTVREKPVRVEVTFAATDALLPSRVRAQYRLLGVDSTWRNAGGRRTLEFGPLRGGAYRFEVRVAGEDGDWHPQRATLALDVPLALRERTWFVPLVVLLLLGGGALVGRWRLRAARQRAQELSHLVEERTRELEGARASLERRVQERTADLERELEERTRLEQRLLSAQKLESIGRLAGGVAHEINNSMSSVLGFTELARHGAEGQPALQADLDEVWRAGRRVADITRQLLAFARRQHTERVSLQLDTLVEELRRSLQQAVGDGATLVLHVPAPVARVSADITQVEQLLVNLVHNARDAMPDGGTITIAVHDATLASARPVGDVTLPPGDYVTVAVSDTGVGMDAQVRARLFEPFFTTKELHRGTGLGLAVCHGIVARHRGGIEVESAPGQGTRFTVWFPAGDAPVDGAVSTDEAPRVSGETILLVEDEEAVREVTSRMLSLSGYRVLEAADGEAALRVVREQPGGTIDLVVTDVRMPGMGGLDLARALRERSPGLPVVFISGYAGLDTDALAALAEQGPMIAKPFTHETLARIVRRELDGERGALARPAVPGRYPG